MTFGAIINTILIGPLKFLFEILFSFAYSLTGNVGISIILLSLAMNFLVLPLYKCADEMQVKARDREMELHDDIEHIKKTFKGDERMMMLQTYYKQNHYSPLSALSGSVSLLLEIPFFIAAYQFLSNAAVLSGATLGPIANLADPDALIKIGSLSINVLPFAMTIINIIASMLFLQGAPLKSKIQLYAMAVFFLVFLYTSPAGLVFYWTLNNVFSLVKTIFYKLKNPRKVFNIMASAVGILLFLLVTILQVESLPIRIACLVMMFVLQIPLAWQYGKKYIKLPKAAEPAKPNKKLFIVGCLFLTVLVGAFIPSTFIAAEPQEFINFQYYKHPNWFVAGAFCLSLGTFVVWFSVFYWLATEKGKVIFDRVVWILCFVMLINYMFFGTRLGNMTAGLQYDNGLNFSALEHVLNIVVVLAAAVGLFFVITKCKKITVSVLTVAVVAISGMSILNVGKITKGVGEANLSNSTSMPTMELSSSGKNVIIVMLDRALGAYFPYIQQEMEARREASGEEYDQPFMDGFTYYSNVISFGDHTNFAAPSLLAGYEYTPVEINKRGDEELREKQNEANLVLPRIFTENEWTNGLACDKAAVFDPIYANYQWISDLSIYEGYDKIQAKNALGAFVSEDQARATVEKKYRDFFCFSLMKSMPVSMQGALYQGGEYNRVREGNAPRAFGWQSRKSNDVAVGVTATFMENYGNLANLSKMTFTTDEDVNRFVYMTNNMTHEVMMLNEDTYEPIDTQTGEARWEVDNTEYNAAHADRFELNGRKLDLNTDDYNVGLMMAHYQTNFCALMKLDQWFQDLQKKGLYDNSRIIVVSDHGYDANTVEGLYDGRFGDSLERYFPLLMVKDFNAHGEVVENTEFMTNADVPVIATQGLIENPTNPFTGKPITSDEKTAHPQYIIDSGDWEVSKNAGNRFKPAYWLSVEDNLWDRRNWNVYKQEKVILTEHKAPY